MNININQPTHIQLTNKNKMKNPYHKGTANKLHGNVADFDFSSLSLNQLNNYDLLCKKLAEVNIIFDKISLSSIERIVRNSTQYGTTFIATTSNPQIFWYKSESQAIGSGGNHMIIGGKKVKVTEFIKMNRIELIKMIDEMAQII